MIKYWFITSAYPNKNGTGSDFYLDSLEFFKSFGFKSINTLEYGHPIMILKELILLFRIPYKSTIITTWVGFPRQLLVLNGVTNKLRFKLFRFVKRIKKWEMIVIPIDLPLRQFGNNLNSKFIRKQESLERIIFNCAEAFLCAGVEMENIFRNEYPGKNIIRFDMYDQILPEYNLEERKSNEVKQIAIIGNLSRMTDEIEFLPINANIQYRFYGPNGDKILKSKRKDFYYHGNLNEEEFINGLFNCDYGLILYSKKVEKYFSSVIAGKLTSFVYASLPVICLSKYTSMSELVKRLNIGIVINELSELVNIISVPKENYNKWMKNCMKEKQRIISGGHYRIALQEINVVVQ